MVRFFRYITHPQVQIDPTVAVPKWGLSELGRARTLHFSGLSLLGFTQTIISSGETKAIETAGIISNAIGVNVEIREGTHENDRSATGFLEPQEFEYTADAFFAEPSQSVRGWERAIDAQSRIVAEYSELVEQNTVGDILMVGHGAVGTLLYCFLAGFEICRSHDQAGGGGNIFTYDLEAERMVHGWRSIESF